MHIAVAGNIGSGKSTLTKMLAKHYGWEAKFETVVGNPYLEDYYRDLHRWSFNLDAGLQLEFMENNAIYIQPGFSYHFPQQVVPVDLQSYYTTRPASFNLTIGYRLLL